MAAKTVSYLRLYGYVIVGLVMVNWVAGDNSTSSPISPLTGYGHFNVSGKDGKICILLDLSCTVSVENLPYGLPLNAHSDGSCSDETSSVTLSWEKNKLPHLETNLTFSMAFKNMGEKWKTTSLTFTARTLDDGTESTISAVQNDSSKLAIAANKGKSFQCSKSLHIALNGKEAVTVTVNKIKVQPFGNSSSEADVCSSSSNGTPAEPVDTVVPTAVGCVLAGLVVILIITYFVGRCKKPGYQKM